MWWIVGIGVLIALVWTFGKYRTATHQAQLIKAGRDHLWQSFRMLNVGSDRFFEAKVDERVWRDPYLLGYAQGSLAMMTTFFGKRLDTTQKGMVVVRVMQDMIGDGWQETCERIAKLNADRDVQFARGMSHGGDVLILMANRAGPNLLAEPDVQMALRKAPEQARLANAIFGSTDTGQSGAAGAVLMQEYMERHAREAG